MKLSPTVRLKLLLDIFRDNGIYVGGWMEFAQLVQAWRHSGLRLTDLEDVVDLAIEFEMIELDGHQGLASVRLLTDNIPTQIDRRQGIRKVTSRAQDAAALTQLRLRKKSSRERGVSEPDRRAKTMANKGS